jgi:hypothetical protein
MPRPKPDDWMMWLTVDESIELIVIKWALRWPKLRSQAIRELNMMRQVACHRRKRNSRRFAIYMQAMGE